MAEELSITQGTKEEKYQALLPQIKALLTGEEDRIANMANFCAALKQEFNFFWIGFYLVKEDQLVLGPFQGSIACTRIQKGKGVCGTAWEQNQTIVVEDVDAFPGHISCSSLSRSEIVVPVRSSGKVIAVLDIDSDQLADFDATDQLYLNEICTWLGDYLV